MRVEYHTLTAQNVAVSGNTVIGAVVLGCEAEWMSVSVAPITAAVDEFVMEFKTHPSSSYASVKAAAGTWATATGAIPITSGNIAATAAAATSLFVAQVDGIYAVRFSASADTSVVTAITIYVTVCYPD